MRFEVRFGVQLGVRFEVRFGVRGLGHLTVAYDVHLVPKDTLSDDDVARHVDLRFDRQRERLQYSHRSLGNGMAWVRGGERDGVGERWGLGWGG